MTGRKSICSEGRFEMRTYFSFKIEVHALNKQLYTYSAVVDLQIKCEHLRVCYFCALRCV